MYSLRGLCGNVNEKLMKDLSEVEVLVAQIKAKKKLAELKRAAYEAKFKNDIAKNRTMAWSKLHKNTRLQRE